MIHESSCELLVLLLLIRPCPDIASVLCYRDRVMRIKLKDISQTDCQVSAPHFVSCELALPPNLVVKSHPSEVRSV